MHRTKIITVSIIVMLVSVAGAAIAHAQGFRSGNDITVPAGQAVDKTLFAAGRTIDIAGTVNGDVFCAGQDVTITGTVIGDVICAGQNVRISGTVAGNVRIVGQDVTVAAAIGHNLTAAGQNFSLESDSRVKGDASVTGQDVTLNGVVGRDLAAASNSVTINGQVGRNVQSRDGNLALGSGSRIGGNVDYVSPQLFDRSSGALVLGTITHKQSAKHSHHASYGAFVRGGLWFALYMFVSLLLVAFVLVLLMSHVFHAATDTTLPHTGRTLLVGFLASIVAPVVVVLLMVTVVGIPLAILLLLTWLVVLILSGVFAAYHVGRLFMIKSTDSILIMMLGAVVLLLLYFIPFLGLIVSLLAGWLGVGIILTYVSRTRHSIATPPKHAKKAA